MLGAVSELGKELEATIRAHQEAPELEPQLVERFVDHLETEIDRRVDQRMAMQRRPARSGAITPMVLGSLGISIPLIAIAGSQAGLAGIIAVCIAIVLVNLFWARGIRH